MNGLTDICYSRRGQERFARSPSWPRSTRRR